MYLRGNAFSSRTGRHEDYHLGTAVGIVIAGYAAFFLILYWLMQPSISPNPGLAAYRPPPKTVVHYADAPWVPPAPAELLPIRSTDRPPAIAKNSVTEEPKKETKKPERRPSARQTQPATQNPFWGWGQGQGQGWGQGQGQASSRGFGSRPWF
jgi:hypothetical protein